MITSSPAILAAIDEFETKARLYETVAGECRDVAAMLRRTFNVSTLVPTAIHQSPPAPPAAKPPAPIVAAPEPVTSAARRSRTDLHEDVRAVIARAGRPMRIGAILQAMEGVTRGDLKVVIRDLCASGDVTKAGEKSACHYSVPADTTPTLTPSDPLPVTDELEAEDDVEDAAAADVVSPEQFRAKVAFFLLKAVLVPGTPVHIGDIVQKVYDRFDSAPLEQVNHVLRDLVSQGEIEQFKKGGEAHYQRALANGPSTFALRADVKKALMTTVFHVSEEVPFESVIAGVKPLAGVSYDVIKQALHELVAAKAVSVRTVGLVRRFRRVAPC